MKVRIQGNSIRFRLMRSEVTRVIEGHIVVSRTLLPFAARPLVFELRKAYSGERAGVSADGLAICVALDRWRVDEWLDPKAIGFSLVESLPNGDSLTVLVEKDFACLDREEEEPDAYPNPKACLIG